MYEHRKEPLLPWEAFLIRLAWHGLGFVAMIGGALGILWDCFTHFNVHPR
jgi:hypothetical protein